MLLEFLLLIAISGLLFFVLKLDVKSRKHILNIFKVLPRDLILIWKFVKISWKVSYSRYTNKTIDKHFKEHVLRNPFKIAFQFSDRKFSMLEIDQASNQAANFFLKKGYKQGDTLAIFIESSPEFIYTWLGMLKIGVITALINTNLKKESLKYCIRVAKSKGIVYSFETKDAVAEIGDSLTDLDQFYYKSSNNEAPLSAEIIDMKKALSEESVVLKSNIYFGKILDVITYIYTSGTTGFPKAAIFTHSRFLLLSTAVKIFSDLNENDNIYTSLPLYHSAALCGGIGQAIINGSTVTIRKKFSASNFWKDCSFYNCTAAQYIGELCRYLLNSPKDPNNETKHNVRIMYGNGLKAEIWEKFTQRFKVKKIVEFYAATEGNATLVNIDGTVGTVGFIPLFLKNVYPATLVKYNPEKSTEPLRDDNGLCMKCDFNEPGLLVGKITKKLFSSEFNGYLDKTETNRKLLHNVLKKQDQYFNTGDILYMDELGYFHFHDRTGDTFRWKGENVSTSEVEIIISKLVNYEDVIVYGVQIPNTEGRVGMAAIVESNEKLKIEGLAKLFKSNLPSYAVPLFLRLLPKAPMTGTFKFQKVELQKQGFDIEVINDNLYFLNQASSIYEKMDTNLYSKIINNEIRC